jgi:carbonic anhydrase
MSTLPAILAHNRRFVEAGEYESFRTDRFPDKKLIVICCMDTRLTELLPRAMNIRQGDAKILKTAGAIVAHPFGGIMRSILVAVYELGAQEIVVVGHHDCGMANLSCERILTSAVARGIDEKIVRTLRHAGIDLDRWLSGFSDVGEAVRQSVKTIRQHPLLAPDILVHGLIIHPETGKLDVVDSPAAP